MKNPLVNSFIVALLVLCCGRIAAQEMAAKPLLPLYDSLTLETMVGYTDLDSALKEPEKVVKLTLRKQKLEEFPVELWKFPNLQYLDLGRNKIKEVPDSIDYFTNLQVLHLSKNAIEFLPREIGELQNLMILDINQNELTSLPPQIGKLKKLRYLDLWSNNLSIFPEELEELSETLQVLDLRVILINADQQDKIRAMLPKTMIYMSPPCKCDQ
jgi:Leucine-rich repeat (LRR) protein